MMFLAHDSDRYGYLAMPNGTPMQPETISRRVGVPLAQYVTLLAELDEAGVPSRTPEGIIFSRRMARDHKQRQLTKIRVRKHRKRNGDVTPSVTPLYEGESEREALAFEVDVGSKSKPIPLKDLEEIYAQYPRQIAKKEALSAIRKALERIESGEYKNKPIARDAAFAGLKTRVMLFADSPAGHKGKYTPHPATWFNRSSYLDDPKEWNDEQRFDNKASTRAQNNQAAILTGLGIGEDADAVCPSSGAGSDAWGDEVVVSDVSNREPGQTGMGLPGASEDESILPKTGRHH